MKVLGGKLSGRSPRERRCAGRHFLKHDRQAVLIARATGPAVEYLGGRVFRSQAIDQRSVRVGHVLQQSKIGDSNMTADEQEVFRLDVEMLQALAAFQIL